MRFEFARWITICLIAPLLLAAAASGCFFGKFNSTESADSQTLSTTTLEAQLLFENQPLENLHTFSTTLPLNVSSQEFQAEELSLCISESTSCDSCSYAPPGVFSLSLTAGSGAKTVSYKLRKPDGAESACSTISFRATDLTAAPEPLVAGKGKFSDRIYYDGSRECGEYPLDAGPTDCAPGAFFRVFKTGYTSCDGLSLTDSGGFFTWKCEVSGGFARFQGNLDYDAKNKRISRVVNSSTLQFKSTRLNLNDNGNFRQGSEGTWWSDPIVQAPSASVGPVDLDQANTVYWMSGQSSFGHSIKSDGVTVLGNLTDTLQQIAISSPRADCYFGANRICLIGAAGRKNLLIEPPMLQMNGTSYAGIMLQNSQRALISGAIAMSGSGGPTAGISMEGSASIWINDSQVSNATNAFYFNLSDRIRVENARAVNSQNGLFASDGIQLEINGFTGANLSGTGTHLLNNDGSTLRGIKISNANHGIRIQNSEQVVLSEFLLNDITNDALFTSDRNSQHFHRGTIVRANRGINLQQVLDDIHLNNIVIAGTTTGILAAGATTGDGQVRASMITTLNNSIDYNLAAPYQLYAWGPMIFDSSPMCSITGTGDIAGPGCSLTPTESGAAQGQLQVTGADPAGSFVGFVTIKDAANGSPLLGATNQITANSIVDWFGFLTQWRSFGEYVANSTILFTPGGSRTCATTDTCQIYDWGLQAAGTGNALRRKLAAGNALGSTTGSGRQYAHTSLQGSETSLACPIEVRQTGSEWTLPSLNGGSPRTVLRMATEKLFDRVGNEDGWCDSGELCFYTPNFGFFQGDDSAGRGLCDQSGDSTIIEGNDEYLVEIWGNDGID